MKFLICLSILLLSMSVFADVGEDRTSTHAGVICQQELDQSSEAVRDDSGASESEVLAD